MQSLVEFALAESLQVTTVTPAQVAARQDLLARMRCRSHFGKLLKPLVLRTSAWPGLQEAGMFNALLALLQRATADCEASEDSTIKSDCKHVCDTLTDCLVKMIQASHGGALLHFFEKQDGLVVLGQASADIPAMHKAVGMFLWQGLAFDTVVDVFVNKYEKGLTLLETLFTSHDLLANILSALCVSTVLRHVAAESLPDGLRYNLHNGLMHIPKYLDDAEILAYSAAAAQRATASGSSVSSPVRDTRLSGLLQSLCSGEDLDRLHRLLGSVESESDYITQLVASLFFHFTQHFVGELETLKSLAPVANHLHELVLSESTSDVVRQRIAFVLTHLDATSFGVSPTGEPPSLESSTVRAYIFEVLHQHARCTQDDIAVSAQEAEVQAAQDDQLVAACRLGDAPCIDEGALDELIQKLRTLQARRGALQKCMDTSKGVLHELHLTLDKQKSLDGILVGDLKKLGDDIRHHSAQEARCEEMSRAVANAEAFHKEMVGYREVAYREEEAVSRSQQELEDKMLQAESQTAKLAAREDELLRVRSSAPTESFRIQEQMQQLVEKIDAAVEQRGKLQASRQEHRHRSEELETTVNYTQLALNKIATVEQKLRGFRESLTSETVVSHEEKQALLALEVELPRRPTEVGSALLADAQAEQEFTTGPNFRSLRQLCDERTRSWKAQQQRLTAQRDESNASEAQAEQEEQSLLQEEQRCKQEYERLSAEQEQLSDHEGHLQRHQEAAEAHAAARVESQTIAVHKAEIDCLLEQRRATLKEAQMREQEAHAKLNIAKEAFSTDVALQSRLRLEVQARLHELWSREKDHMRDLSLLTLDRHHLRHCLQQVRMRFEEETEARAAVRAHALVLARALTELDTQLTSPDSLGLE